MTELVEATDTDEFWRVWVAWGLCKDKWDVVEEEREMDGEGDTRADLGLAEVEALAAAAACCLAKYFLILDSLTKSSLIGCKKEANWVHISSFETRMFQFKR